MSKPRILIIDDESSIRGALKRWFSIHGFEADVAQDGAEGVRMVGTQRYAVVVLDLEMPTMGGVQATREIKAVDPGTPHHRRVRLLGVRGRRNQGWRLEIPAETPAP